MTCRHRTCRRPTAPTGDSRAPRPPGARMRCRRIDEVDRPEVWITLRAADGRARRRRGASTPRRRGREPAARRPARWRSRTTSTSRGLPTTAAAPIRLPRPRPPPPPSPASSRRAPSCSARRTSTSSRPGWSAPAVRTAPCGARGDPDRVSGGSSSGSAVAVALGHRRHRHRHRHGRFRPGAGRAATASSGSRRRSGVIPTARRRARLRRLRLRDRLRARSRRSPRPPPRIMAGPTRADPRSRRWPADVRLAAPAQPRVACPGRRISTLLCAGVPRSIRAHGGRRWQTSGIDIEEVDISPLLDAARLLYDGAFVAERYAAVGRVPRRRAGGCRPDGRRDRRRGGETGGATNSPPTSTRSPAPRRRRRGTARRVRRAPAAHHHRTPDDRCRARRSDRHQPADGHVHELLQPAGHGRGRGPGRPDRRPATRSASCSSCRRSHDQVAVDLAARLAGVHAPALVEDGVELAVFGAHLRGQPLHFQLEDLGARFADTVTTTTPTGSPRWTRHRPSPASCVAVPARECRSSANCSGSRPQGSGASSRHCPPRWR